MTVAWEARRRAYWRQDDLDHPSRRRAISAHRPAVVDGDLQCDRCAIDRRVLWPCAFAPVAL